MVLLVAGPATQTVLRLITWPFRSEMRLFLILSVVSLLICILELVFYPDLNADEILDQADESLVAANLTASDAGNDDVGFSSMLEIKSVFIPCVFSLFSLIFVVGKLIQFIFFGSLSETERSNLSRLLFRFTVFRVIILSGAINVSRLSSVFGWLVWFGLLGLIHACALTATSRCNQLAASSLVTRREWLRLSCALTFLLVGNWYLLKGGLYNCFLLADISVSEGGDLATGRSIQGAFKTPTALGVLKSKLTGRRELIYDAVDVVAYILAESMLLFCLIVHLIGGFLVQAYDRWQLAHGRSWPQQTTVSYYLDLVHVLVYRFVEIAHYLHLLLWSRIFSVASLIVFLHIRFAYSMLANRIRQHVTHRRLSRYIAEHFDLQTSKSAINDQKNKCEAETDCTTHSGKVADQEESLKLSDRSDSNSPSDVTIEVCAICWEPMHTWRRLPCRHNFHEYCLRSWLEQNPTCPTCRRDLGIPLVLLANSSRNGGAAAAAAGLVGVAGAFPNDQAAMGFWLRNIGRNAEGILNPPTNVEPAASPPAQAIHTNFGQAATTTAGMQHPARNLFATAVGLNLGMSIGSGAMVAAAAQAVARDAAPGTSRTANVRIDSQGVSSASDGGNQGQLTGEGVSRGSGLQVQQSSPTETITTATIDEGNHVRRRSFHFDGSRYFSWLPSLHVELSDVIREVFAAGADQFTQVVDDLSPRPTPPAAAPIRPELGSSTADSEATRSFNPDQFELIRLPASLRQPAQEIARMFPQFSLSTIVADLLRTGVPEMTVENLITRPPPPSPQSSELRYRFPAGVGTDASASSNTTGTDASNESVAPVASTSSSSADLSQQTTSSAVDDATNSSIEPESLLAIRRRSMLEQARKRFLSRNAS